MGLSNNLRKVVKILTKVQGKDEKDRELIGKALYELYSAVDFYSQTTVGSEVYETIYDC